MVPVAIGAALGIAGSVAKGIGAIKAGKVAKTYDQLATQLPTAQKSQYIDTLIGGTQSVVNANPLAAAQQRAQQGSMANALYAARSGDRGSLAALASAMSGQSEQAALQASAADEQLRQQRRQAYYQALESGMQDEQNLFANKITEIQNKANLARSSAQARQKAWAGAGDALAGVGNIMSGPGGQALAGLFGKKTPAPENGD